MKLILCSLHISTKRAFSARNPYPGWSIVHPLLIAADRTFGINKYLHTIHNKKFIYKLIFMHVKKRMEQTYDWLLGASPIQTASSANFT